MRGLVHRKAAVYVLVLVVFAVLAIIYTRPLAANADDHLIGAAGGDNYFSIYVLSWDAHALGSDPLNLFNATMFYPSAHSLAFSDHELTSALVAWPVLAITGNGVLALNFAVFVTFLISAFGAYLLVEHLARDRAAGMAAGIVFGFAMYKTAQITHLQLLSAGFIPLAMLFLHRYTEKKKPADAFGFALFAVLLFWAVWSYGFYLAFAVLIYLLVLAVFERRRIAGFFRRRGDPAERRALCRWAAWLLAAVLAAGLVLLPFALPYLRAQRENPSFGWDADEVASYSADLGDFLVAPSQSLVWGPLSSWARPRPYLRGNATERSLFCGLLPLLLGAAGAVFLYRRRTRRERFVLVFYGLLGGLAVVLCLGPTLYIGGHQFSIRMPYRLMFRFFPGFQAMRTPARIYVLALLSLCVLTGFGVRWLKEKLQGRLDRPLVSSILVFLLALVFVEVLPGGLVMKRAPLRSEFPAAFGWLADRAGPSPYVVLPVAPYRPGTPSGMDDVAFAEYEPRRLYYNTANWKKMVNGYSGYIPASYRDAVRALAGFPSLEAFRFLRDRKVRYAVLESELLEPGVLERALEWARGDPRVELVYSGGGDYVLELGR